MSFKDEYTRMQSDIKPRAEFLEDLARQMEQARQNPAEPLPKRKSPMKLRTFIIAAGAVTAAAAAAAVFAFAPSRGRPAPLPIKDTTVTNKFYYNTGSFGNKTGFSDSKPVPVQLAEMLSDSKTVLYKSNTNKFDYEDRVDDGSRMALAERIKNAAKTDPGAPEGGDRYMMTLANGDVFKFGISKDILEVENNFYKIP